VRGGEGGQHLADFLQPRICCSTAACWPNNAFWRGVLTPVLTPDQHSQWATCACTTHLGSFSHHFSTEGPWPHYDCVVPDAAAAAQMVANSRSSEAFVAACLLTVGGSSLLTKQLGLSDTLGAFVAGVLLSETSFRTQVRDWCDGRGVSASMTHVRGVKGCYCFCSQRQEIFWGGGGAGGH